jgi:holliday junction DNA helicase RuvA
MIGRISGFIMQIKVPTVLVDVMGVGYEVDLPVSDCALLPSIGANIVLFTHLIIREDCHSLYGFVCLESRDCFRTLIKVSGVGPRTALALLSTLTPVELNSAVENSDSRALCRAPGIGKKVAERMILELKGKLGIYNLHADSSSGDDTKNTLRIDMTSALLSLGYQEKEIVKAIKNLPNEIIDLTTGIKEALRLLNK